jgi:phytoene dehydrogenase-like protein
VLLRTHVEEVLVENGRAAGVRLRRRGGSGGAPAPVIRARKAVVSNASVWDTLRLVPQGGLRVKRAVAAGASHAVPAEVSLAAEVERSTVRCRRSGLSVPTWW